MVSCLNLATLITGTLGFVLFCVSSGTNRWKEDIDFYKNTHSYIGLWRACFWSVGRPIVGYPPIPLDCDKDFLRPHRTDPPSWFTSCRCLMMLACIGSGFGILFYLLALVTDNSKRTGSKFWPAALVIFISGFSGAIALVIFTYHKQWGLAMELGGEHFYAQYWKIIEEKAIIQGGEYKMETWLRWSYMVGWGGVLMTLCCLICAILSDLLNQRRN